MLSGSAQHTTATLRSTCTKVDFVLKFRYAGDVIMS